MRRLITIVENANNHMIEAESGGGFRPLVDEDFLTEKFHKGFVSFQGKTCEVFHNPSPKEYRECMAGNDQVRAFLIGDDILVWNVFSALHQMVRDELRLPNDVIPLVIYGDLGDVCDVDVTDNSRNTVWWHNREVSDVIQSNAYLSRLFIAVRVGYYDENIVGDWTLLDYEEEEEEELDEGVAANAHIRVIPREDDIYDAYIGDTKVGHAQIDIHRPRDPENVRKIFRTHVKTEYRRMGVATALYDKIESDLGKQGLVLRPATGGALSDEAREFWKSRDPSRLD